MRFQRIKNRSCNVVGAAELVNAESELLNARFAQSGPSNTWTGLVDVDEALGEATDGTVLEVRCASPMLRSAFLVGVAVAMARTGQRTLLVADAAASDQIGLRLLSQLSNVHVRKLRDARRLNERDWSGLVTAVSSELPISIYSRSKHSKRFTARRLRRIGNFDVLVLDGDDINLIRRATGIGRRVVWGPTDSATHHGAVRPSLGLSLSLLGENPTPLKVVEAVVDETQILPRCKVRLMFDQNRLRFLNGTAATIEAEADEEGSQLAFTQ